MPRAWIIGLLLLLAPAVPARADTMVRILSDGWTQGDERGYGEFIAAIGAAACRTVDSCLHDPANPFRASDPAGAIFESDCADLPYVLRFYYAWKRGLPFSYVNDVSPRGRSRDIRYSPRGNQVEARRDVLTGEDGLLVLARLRDDVSSATYRIHPELDGDDLYSPALTSRAIRPGTVIYDPNGHLAIIWKIEPDGRVHYIDAHPDNSLTRGTYDRRFVRASPGMGAGFKNWRPMRLVGARPAADGALLGGRIVPARNSEIADFALTQFFGTGARPDDSDWKTGGFVLNGAGMDYYDYVRAVLGGGRLRFDPLREVADMVMSNCADLGYRARCGNRVAAGRAAERAATGPVAGQHLWHRGRLGDFLDTLPRCPPENRLQGTARRRPAVHDPVAGPRSAPGLWGRRSGRRPAGGLQPRRLKLPHRLCPQRRQPCFLRL
jgi:hypothetical protein